MISKFVIQKHFSGSRDFVRQPRRMALLLLVGGDVILTGSEARIWKKGTVHCILLSSGWSGGESLTCGPPISGIAPNHPLESSAVVCKNSVQPVGLRDPHFRRLSRVDLGFESAEQLQDECSFVTVHSTATPSRLKNRQSTDTPGFGTANLPADETKFLRLFRPAAIGDGIDAWRMCWIGAWDKCRVSSL